MTLGEANVTGGASEVLPPAGADPAQRSHWRERTMLVALCALVGWFYVWTVRSSGDAWNFGAEQNDYYNLLIDGWLDGHLHMKVEVPEALLKLSDPYDPNLRPPGLGLHDASFYKGKYYLYFGAAPMAVLMLPFRILTGTDLPQAVAALVFVFGGFLASVAILLGIRRRYFSETGTAALLLCVAVLGLAGLGPVLLRRPHMWELPIGAGYCFAMLTLVCAWRSLHSAGRRGWWFAGAGFALGLAIASRPTYLIASPLLAAPLLRWWRVERRLPWRMALWAAGPLAFVGALMAWHNYARFGNPLQFGQAYQFSLDYESKVTHFAARYVPFNGWRYFFSAAQWSPYFPFIQPAELPPKPPGFAGHDDVYGVLRNMPFAWLALFAPLALWRRESDERCKFRAWLGSVSILFCAMAGVLLFFFGSLARYQSDFTPALMLLACVGALSVERWTAARSRIFGASARTAWGLMAVGSALFAVLFSIQLDGLLGERNPANARAVAEALNKIPAVFERLRGVQHGAVELDLQFPPRMTGEQVLLTVGDAPRVARVFVRALDDDEVQIGIAQGTAPEILSRPVTLDVARTHTLRVALGALLPPSTHPFFARRSPAEISQLTRLVRIGLDGEDLIDERRRFDGGTGRLRVGRAVVVPGAVPFEGEVRAVRRVALEPDLLPANGAGGFVRMHVTLAKNAAMPREPLVACGAPTDGSVVFLHYLGDAGRIAFGSSARGDRSEISAAMIVDPKRVHEITIRWESVSDSQKRRVQLRVNGIIAWTREVAWPERDGAVVVGRNVSNEPGCAAQFTGEIQGVHRSSDTRDPLLGPGDTLRLRVQLPPGRTGTREPLVVTGRHGAGDLLMIEYVDERTVRFALDHWGSAMLVSPHVTLSSRRYHHIDVTMSSLAAPADLSLERHVRRGRVAVGIEGARVWETETELFTADAEEFAIGRNPIGGTSCGPAFSGEVLVVERLAP